MLASLDLFSSKLSFSNHLPPSLHLAFHYDYYLPFSKLHIAHLPITSKHFSPPSSRILDSPISLFLTSHYLSIFLASYHPVSCPTQSLRSPYTGSHKPLLPPAPKQWATKLCLPRNSWWLRLEGAAREELIFSTLCSLLASGDVASTWAWIYTSCCCCCINSLFNSSINYSDCSYIVPTAAAIFANEVSLNKDCEQSAGLQRLFTREKSEGNDSEEGCRDLLSLPARKSQPEGPSEDLPLEYTSVCHSIAYSSMKHMF